MGRMSEMHYQATVEAGMKQAGMSEREILAGLQDRLEIPRTSAVTRPYVNEHGTVIGRVGVDWRGQYFAEPIRVNHRGGRYYDWPVRVHTTQEAAEAELVALATEEGLTS